MKRSTSGAEGNGLYTTTKTAGIGLGTTIKHLRRTTSGTAGRSLGAAIPLVVQSPLKKNSESHTGARPSVRLCVGPELARCVHRAIPPQYKVQ